MFRRIKLILQYLLNKVFGRKVNSFDIFLVNNALKVQDIWGFTCTFNNENDGTKDN